MRNTKLYNPTYYFGYSFFHFKINGKFITVIFFFFFFFLILIDRMHNEIEAENKANNTKQK